MSSILTNNGAMVALQTLQTVNKNLGTTQSEISTGRKVANAKDNSAVWAISKQMESDVQGFKSIQESLALGESTVSVARNASETITDLLTEIKGKIVASQEENVDRSKIQTDIAALRDQIGSVVGAAQFNGLNLLSNKSNEAGSSSVNILSSLDRSGSTVKSSDINVGKQDLGTEAAVLGATAVGAANDLLSVSGASAAAAGGTVTVSFTAGGAQAGASYSVSLTGVGGQELGTSATTFSYVARDGDTEADVSNAIFDKMTAFATENELADTAFTRNATTGAITVTNNDATAANTITVARAETLDGTAEGGLAALSDVDVTSQNGASSALSNIESLIQTSINAAASFGSAQGRIETQKDFISKLSDSLTTGIGALVDANLEEASARLQALQVQQQLATQSLSIANQAPQSILSLFR